MHKEQLMRLHQFFIYTINEIVPDDFKESDDCKKILELYEKLNVKPHHIYRLKCEQKAAILLLATCLAKYLSEEINCPKNLAEKFEENALKHLKACRGDLKEE
ncbi:UPF0058 family protein [Methanocaldococcus indicus]|uniref:UPF0058 family protein n=1 Tax=Methanocaldococcus indicus TaxID=213231 RepID=UPI003C6DA0D2